LATNKKTFRRCGH